MALDSNGPTGAGALIEFKISTGATARVVYGPGYDFYGPTAMAAQGPDLFVASSGSTGSYGAVTEVNAATGALVRVMTGEPYGFGAPLAVAVDAGHLFVVDRSTGGGPIEPSSLTEVNASTGGLVKILAGPGFEFNYSWDVLADGPDVFVGNLGFSAGHGPSITELDASTGALVRVFAGPDIVHPIAMARDGTHLLVLNNSVGSVVEMPA